MTCSSFRSGLLRQVNANLVKLDERATLVRLVDIMMSLNLRFERDKTEDGQPIFVLEPWVLPAAPRALAPS